MSQAGCHRLSQTGCHRLSQVVTQRSEPRREATHPTLMRAHAWPAHHHPARPVVGCTRPRTPPGTQRGWGVRRGAQLSQHRPARLSKGACGTAYASQWASQLRIAHSEFDSHFPLGDQVLSSLAKQRIAWAGAAHTGRWTLCTSSRRRPRRRVAAQAPALEENGGSQIGFNPGAARKTD